MQIFVFALAALLCPFGVTANNCTHADPSSGTRSNDQTCIPNSNVSNPEALHKRQFYYIGGQYASASPGGVPGTYWQDAMYVEQLTPQHPTQPFPLVMIHGGGPSGTTWLQTPDGRKGWASYFLERGYTVYLVDLPYTGRSGEPVDLTYSPPITVSGAQSFFTAGKTFGVNFWPQAVNHTQFPGARGVQGEAAFDAFYKSILNIPKASSDSFTLYQKRTRSSGAALLNQIGPAFLFAHSLGGWANWLIADAAPAQTLGIVGLEPASPPGLAPGSGAAPLYTWGLTNAELTYSPAVNGLGDLQTEVVGGPSTPAQSNCTQQKSPAKQLVNLATIPQLFLTSEAGIHATYDQCTVGWLRQAGVNLNWTKLEDVGIHGNSHFMHLELNNLDIAAYAEDWVLNIARSKLATDGPYRWR